jgi:hypothetical protein
MWEGISLAKGCTTRNSGGKKRCRIAILKISDVGNRNIVNSEMKGGENSV